MGGAKGFERMSFFLGDLAAPAVSDKPSIEWEEADCLLCGSRNWSPLVEAPDSTPGGTGLWFAVVQCQECGLCFTNPRPSVANIGQFYPAVYRPHRSPRRRPGRWRLRSVKSQEQPRKEGQILSWRGQGRLLDFGCGGGSFLAYMQRKSWKVTGLDVSMAAVQRVRKELGLRALLGSLPHPELRPSSFDLITMSHSLEHWHAPMDVLRAPHRVLLPADRRAV